MKILSVVITALWRAGLTIGRRCYPAEHALEFNGKKHKKLARLTHSFVISWPAVLL